MTMDLITCYLNNGPDDKDLPLLIDADKPNRSLSWHQHMSVMKRTAVGLRGLGLSDGEAVGMISETDIYFHALGNGVIAAGGTFVPIPVPIGQADLINCLNFGECKWLMVTPDRVELALATLKELGWDTSHLLIFDPPGLEPYKGPYHSFTGLLQASEDSWQLPACAQDPQSAIAYRSFTSGTTGFPKAANVSHASCVRRIIPMTGVPGFSTKTISFNAIQTFHPSGIGFYQRAIAGGCVLYMSNVTDPVEYLDKMHERKVSYANLSPRSMDQFVSVIQSGQRSASILEHLRLIVSIGSRSRVDTVETLKSYLPEEAVLSDAYASTECGIIAGTLGRMKVQYPCIGPIFPKVEVKIIDFDTLRELPKGDHGEICVRSPYLFDGYHNNPTATAASFMSGTDSLGDWFRTGDKGYFDPKTGYLAISGRFKEVFKVRYEEVSPVEVESEIMRLEGVDDAAVTSTPARDNETDCEAVAYVVRKDGVRQISAQDVVDWVARRMARHKVPEGGVIFVDEIPRNAMHKTIRGQLAALPERDGSARFLTASA